MSDSSPNGEHAPEAKGIEVQSSVRAVCYHNGEPIYEMCSHPSQMRGTETDEHEMEVLRRKQQLNVSQTREPEPISIGKLIRPSATTTLFQFSGLLVHG